MEKLCIRNSAEKDGDEEGMPAAATETIGRVSEPEFQSRGGSAARGWLGNEIRKVVERCGKDNLGRAPKYNQE